MTLFVVYHSWWWLAVLCATCCFSFDVVRADTTVDATVVGQYRKSQAGSGEWMAVALSANGEIGIAIRSGHGFYKSTDFSQTWTQLSNALQEVSFYNVACNADCSRIYSTALPYGFYYSEDSGKSWINNTDALPPSQFLELAASGSGQYIHVAGTNTALYSSSDSGVTFTISASFAQATRSWSSISCSSDGRVVVATIAASVNGGIFISQNYGNTYDAVNSLPDYFSDATVSYDGQTMFAVQGYYAKGGLWKSTDGGGTWSIPENVPNTTFNTVVANAGSQDIPGGQYIVLVSIVYNAPEPPMYASWGSVDFGENWSYVEGSYLPIIDLASSTSGYLVSAVSNFENIYTYTPGCPTGYDHVPYDAEGFDYCQACGPGYYTEVRPDTDYANAIDGMNPDANVVYDVCIGCPIGTVSTSTAAGGEASCTMCPYPTSTPHTGCGECSAIWLNVNPIVQLFLFTALGIWLVIVIVVYSQDESSVTLESSKHHYGELESGVAATETETDQAMTAQYKSRYVAIFLILGPALLDFLTDVAYLLTSRFYDTAMFVVLVLFFLHPVPMFIHRVYKVGAWYPAIIDQIWWLGYSTTVADAERATVDESGHGSDSGGGGDVDVSADHIPYPTMTFGPTTRRFVLIISIDAHDNLVGLGLELLTWLVAVVGQVLTLIFLPMFVIVWFLIGCLFQMTKTITMTRMWDLWFRVWTNSDTFRDIGGGGVDTHMLNYALLAQFVLETLPNIVIQPVNNTLLGSWLTSSIAILSFCMSCFMLANVLYKYAYYSVLVRERTRMQHIPIDKTVKISVKVFSFAVDWTILDAKLDPYRIVTRGTYKGKGSQDQSGSGCKPLLADCEDADNDDENRNLVKTNSAGAFVVAPNAQPKKPLHQQHQPQVLSQSVSDLHDNANAAAVAVAVAITAPESNLPATATTFFAPPSRNGSPGGTLTSVAIPHECICPISHQLMTDPVICPDGYTYNRSHLVEYLNAHGNCSPITKLPLDGNGPPVLIPNRAILALIQRHNSNNNSNNNDHNTW